LETAEVKEREQPLVVQAGLVGWLPIATGYDNISATAICI